MTKNFIVLAISIDTGAVVQVSDRCTFERAQVIMCEYFFDYAPCRVHCVPLW